MIDQKDVWVDPRMDPVKYAILDGKTVTHVLFYIPRHAPEGAVEVTDATGEAGPGFAWDGKTFIRPPKPAPTADQVRARRDSILRNVVDPLVSNPLRWTDMPQVEKTAWVVYRQALLDVPGQPGFPEAVTWPEPPA